MASEGELSGIDAAARTLSVLGGLTVVASAFLPWTTTSVVALDLGLAGWEPGATPTIAVALVVLGGLPALAGVIVGWSWPSVTAAVGTGALVIAYLATAPAAGLTTGVWTALGGAVALLLSVGLSAPRRRGRDV